MKSVMGLGFAAFAVLFVMLPSPTSSATDEFPLEPQLVADNNSVILEKKIISMHISEDNQLPWGFVEGNVINPAEGYPVIIQIYKNGEPVHFAQTDVQEDGSYEYRFRVRNVDGDQVINIFQGDYTVKIFKTVYATPQAQIV
ncbi:MAG TPA: hypothetical protein VLB45_07470 [Nitrosopumilaceae archaeon]|nr:hypothetical protein [Nitrosopumilaceae archaeon]